MPSAASSSRDRKPKRAASAPKRNKRPSAARLRQIRALVLDCDGVLTPSDLFYDSDGRRILRFSSKDGAGLALLCRRTEIRVAVLSGRPTDIAEKRHRELGVHHFVGKCYDKAMGLRALCQTMEVPLSACAYVGDDIPDVPAFQVAGLRIAVADATAEIRARADWVTKAPGGRGAVREVCEQILKARGEWQRWLEEIGRMVPGA